MLRASIESLAAILLTLVRPASVAADGAPQTFVHSRAQLGAMLPERSSAVRESAAALASGDVRRLDTDSDPSTPIESALQTFHQRVDELAQQHLPQVVPRSTTANGALARSAWCARNQGQDEKERQRSLDALQLHNTDHDAIFNRIVEMARSAYGTKRAAFVLIDHDREWVKAGAGFDIAESSRPDSFCAVTILHEQLLVVPDARDDLLFFDYPTVEAGMVRFYAGCPIESPDGLRIGALCVSDPEPREQANVDTTLLQSLALEIQRRLW